MPFLDVIQLFFNPAATIEEANSIFCKEWTMTLEYVLRQSGLKNAYVSSLSEERNLFVFLIWVSEDARSHFYHQTTGFGFLSERMGKPPSVYFFDDDEYEKLDEIHGWTIDVFSAQSHGAGELQWISEVQKKLRLGKSGQYNFVARQDRAKFKKLYEGNNFSHALISVTATDSGLGPAPTSDFKHECYKIALRKCDESSCPAPLSTTIEAPADIADLTSKQPQEYGVLSSDEGEFQDTAYPMSLCFRPMSTLHTADNFLPERSHLTSTATETTDQYIICIVSITPIAGSERGGNSIEIIREELALTNDIEGLRKLRLLRVIAPSDESEVVRLVCTWNTFADLTRWWQELTTSTNAGPNTNAKIDCTWNSERIGWSLLEWDSMPLAKDKQHWQEVDKILEVVGFRFARGLSAGEKTAFEGHVHTLINTMSSYWSGDIDERPVVTAETPVWTTNEDTPSSCLLFLAWDGTEQRRAWLLNFMANSFEWTGHIAHTLGTVCSSVESETYEMEHLYTRQDTCETSGGCDLDKDDSDRDMGF